MRKLQLGSQWILWSCLMAAPMALQATPALAQSGAGPGAEPPPAAEPAEPAEPTEAPEAAPVDEAPAAEVVEEPPPEPPAAEEPAAADANVGAAVQFGPSGSTAGVSAGGAGEGGQPRQINSGNATVSGPATASEDEWKFSYNGYFRAPMRIGVGEREAAKTDQSETTFGQPRIPDDQYLSWQYTKQNQRQWAEMFFGYGSQRAKGTLAIQAFNFTDSSFNNQDAQAGISQAWVTINPDMMDIDEDMRVQVKVGTFWGRYGGMGRYDAGAYDTFLFGRTHMMGEAVRMEYDLDDTVFWVEEGFGTKEPNPDPNHNTKFTLLAHLHAGFNYDEFLEVGGHVLHAWTQEPDRECFSREEEWAVQEQAGLAIQAQFSEAPVGACKQEDPSTANANQLARADSPDGSMTVFGADAVLNTSGFGRIYAGYSRVIGNKAVTVAPAIEVIHAYGGGFFNMGITHQYFLEPHDWEPQTLADQMSATTAAEYRRVRNDRGNGHIDTIAGQWDVSLASLIGPDLFGQQQLDLKLFGMLNLVSSDDDDQLANISKLKFGSEILYSPLSWWGIGGRFDRVAPRSDVPEQTFTVVGPRMVFRSDFATHEEINIGWSHYFYAQKECERPAGAGPGGLGPIAGQDLLYCVQPPGGPVGPAGFGYRPGVNAAKAQRGGPVEQSSPTGPFPDKGWDPPHDNTFYISASMWW